MSEELTDRKETAYQMYAGGQPAGVTIAYLGIDARTYERWRSDGGWVARRAAERSEVMQLKRAMSDDSLADAAPEMMRKAITLATREATSAAELRVQADLLKYLLGSLGWSPAAAADRIKAIARGDAAIEEALPFDADTAARDLNLALGYGDDEEEDEP
jgi:hypothetical protein